MIHALASWSHVVDHIWKLNLQAALLAVIVAVVCLVGRRWLTPGWRSILWMLVFVRLVIPFGPSSTLSLGNLVNASFATRSADVNTVETTRPDHETRPVGPESGPPLLAPSSETSPARVRTKMVMVKTSSRWSARDACTAIWLTVAAFLLGRLGWLRVRLSRYLSRLEVIHHGELIRLAESAASVARLTRVPRLLWGSPQCGPAVCGWSFPVLILPRDSAILQRSQLRAVLLHEFRHVRTADTLLTWLPRVLCATFWFNPLLWFASRKWHEERELSCDEWVLRQIGQDQKRSYLETLVAIATRSSRSAALELTASIVSSYAILERRIVAMKRFHSSTRTGLIAGWVLTLLAGAIGLTDAAQAPNEPATKQNSAQVPTASTDQDTGTPVAKQATNQQVAKQPATTQVAPQVQTLKPKVVFAQHVILWEGTEILTRDQLKQRLAKLRATQSVKPSVYHSLGFAFKDNLGAASEAEANERLNKTIGESLELIGRDQWSFMSFLSRRGSGAVDRIRTEDDLKINPVRSLKGRVVVSDDIGRAAGLGIEGKSLVTTTPAKGAQVVILPFGEPCFVRLRDGKLRDPEDEIWYETDAEGMFQADPASLAFDPVLLYGDGKYLTLILHESGYRVINGQLAASDATYELLPWTKVTIDARNLKEHEQIEIWMTPEGAHEKFPELSIGWVGHSDRPVTVKLPRGKGHVAYWSKVEDRWNDTEVRHPIQMTAAGPTEITLPAVP
ncbi:MAG TPA: M56 family metallopeptidase [Pirellulales bacterium]|jgi:bla regulator protein BlaR1|nr:M56 family metallopeptidase [Pirellulales bacterium]